MAVPARNFRDFMSGTVIEYYGVVGDANNELVGGGATITFTDMRELRLRFVCRQGDDLRTAEYKVLNAALQEAINREIQHIVVRGSSTYIHRHFTDGLGQSDLMDGVAVDLLAATDRLKAEFASSRSELKDLGSTSSAVMEAYLSLSSRLLEDTYQTALQ